MSEEQPHDWSTEYVYQLVGQRCLRDREFRVLMFIWRWAQGGKVSRCNHQFISKYTQIDEMNVKRSLQTLKAMGYIRKVSDPKWGILDPEEWKSPEEHYDHYGDIQRKFKRKKLERKKIEAELERAIDLAMEAPS